ncbi:hypothetical protein KEM55_002791 [Ascosphaera atra]|nr:hypothetical protein KEM55_002791 [Ascosphaera atra]
MTAQLSWDDPQAVYGHEEFLRSGSQKHTDTTEERCDWMVDDYTGRFGVQWKAEQRAYPQNSWCRLGADIFADNAELPLADLIKFANDRFALRAAELNTAASALDASTASSTKSPHKRAASVNQDNAHQAKKAKSTEHVAPKDQAQDEASDEDEASANDGTPGNEEAPRLPSSTSSREDDSSLMEISSSGFTSSSAE